MTVKIYIAEFSLTPVLGFFDSDSNILERPNIINEPPHGKTNNLHMRKQRRRSASRLISAFVFATRIVQFLFYLNPKFQASSSFLCLYSPVCDGPVRKPHCWFFHEVAQIMHQSFVTTAPPPTGKGGDYDFSAFIALL